MNNCLETEFFHYHIIILVCVSLVIIQQSPGIHHVTEITGISKIRTVRFSDIASLCLAAPRACLYSKEWEGGGETGEREPGRIGGARGTGGGRGEGGKWEI